MFHVKPVYFQEMTGWISKLHLQTGINLFNAYVSRETFLSTFIHQEHYSPWDAPLTRTWKSTHTPNPNKRKATFHVKPTNPSYWTHKTPIGCCRMWETRALGGIPWSTNRTLENLGWSSFKFHCRFFLKENLFRAKPANKRAKCRFWSLCFYITIQNRVNFPL